MTFWASLLALLSSLFGVFNKTLDWLRKSEYVEQGKELKEAEIIRENEEIEKKQTEILIQDRTKEEVIDKMEKGTF